MQNIKYLFLLTLMISTLFTHASAAKIYRRIPFDVYMNQTDNVVVNYDFTEKRGIHCTASYSKLSIDFIYKGHQKSAFLPVTLQSDHVPEMAEEELADVNGQFVISTTKIPPANQQLHVCCDYVNNQIHKSY